VGSVLKSTFILGSGSAIGLLASLAANKVYAILIGPEGIGLLGLLQGLLGITTLLAGMGLSSGLVRLGSGLVSRGDDISFAALRQMAWQIYFWFSGGVVILLLLFRNPIARTMLVNSPAWLVGVVALALFISLAAGIQIGLLNAHHQVQTLAQVTALATLLGSGIGVVLVWFWGSVALPGVLLTTPLSQWLISRIFALRLPRTQQFPSQERLSQARTELLRFGLPFTASQLVGSAVQLGMPFLVLHQLGQQEVGYYKAAILFSSAYIGFLLNALAQDFYPRLSALRNQRGALLEALNTQQRFVLLLGSSLVVVSIAVVSIIVPLVFSTEFKPTVDILRWQLLGDLFKFVSWTLGFAVLAGSKSLVYFLCELAGGSLLFAFSWWGMQTFGIRGLGIGYLLGYVTYLFIMTAVVAWQLTWKPLWSNISILALAVVVVFWVQSQSLVWGLGVALIWAAFSFARIIGSARIMRWAGRSYE
jgi:O-antigen/teichoic acid export membrane protein